MKRVALSEAIGTGRLEEFIVQEEARGVRPADRKKLDALLDRTIKAPPAGRQTSRSQDRAGSRGK
jgi:hypothetical protein